MPNLKQLGTDLKRIDCMIVDLIRRRIDVAKLVGFEKARTRQPMFRPDIEDQRLEDIGKYAKLVGVDPNFARTILYSLINESCKRQTILLQDADSTDFEAIAGEERRAALRENLLELAEVTAPTYDSVFYGDDFFSRAHSSYEARRLDAHISKNNTKRLALDLGCGTGRASIRMSHSFEKVIGYDVSQHMHYHANLNIERLELRNIAFECRDIENGLPFADESVSFINMNYGAASDFCDLPAVILEIQRVLEPSGGLFMSFYNQDSISQKFGFLPWRTDRASTLNPYTNCLEVSFDGQEFSIFAKPYSISEVSELLGDNFNILTSSSYPFLSSILPKEALDALEKEEDLIELDNMIAERGENFGGAYLICEAQKK